MSTKTYTLSLTRWHKVAERLGKDIAEQSKSVRYVLTRTVVSEYLGEMQEARLCQARDESLAQLQTLFALQDAVAHIRQALSQANETAGVSRLLATYDKLVKRSALLEEIVTGQDAGDVSISELKHVKHPARNDDWPDRGKTKISIVMVDGEALAQLRRQASEAKAAMYGCADQVAELNKATLTLELPEAIAKRAGL